MDGVASAIAIIDETKKIIRWAIDFWNAPEEHQAVRHELENLDIILQRLQEMCEEAEPGALWLKSLWRECGEKGTLVELQLVLGELANSMHPTNRIKKSHFVQRSIWHWKKEKITDLQNKINKALQFILVELGLKHDATLTKIVGAIGKASKAIETGLDGIDERLSRIELDLTEEHERRRREEEERAKEKADIERQEIVAWLSPLSFIAKREQLFNECLKETGDWLWQDQRFKCWTEGRDWHLYCIGDMGVGKTVLSSILTHHLPKSPHPPLILNLYLNYKASKTQTIENLICSLLKQIFQLDEDRPVPEELSNLYRRAKHIQTSADNYQDQIYEMLVKELGKYNEFYVIVDGSDELPSVERSKLLKKLQRLPRKKSRIVIMTRPIQGETRKVPYPVCDNPECEETNVRIWYQCGKCNDGNFDLCLACSQRGFWCLDRSHQLKEVSHLSGNCWAFQGQE